MTDVNEEILGPGEVQEFGADIVEVKRHARERANAPQRSGMVRLRQDVRELLVQRLHHENNHRHRAGAKLNPHPLPVKTIDTLLSHAVLGRGSLRHSKAATTLAKLMVALFRENEASGMVNGGLYDRPARVSIGLAIATAKLDPNLIDKISDEDMLSMCKATP